MNAQMPIGFITRVLRTYILLRSNQRSVLGDARRGSRAVCAVRVAAVGARSPIVLMPALAGRI